MSSVDSVDQKLMALALREAVIGLGRAAPNPCVGAVVVKDGVVVGSGGHERVGMLHAEGCALKEAGSAARGATLFVTLEPCCHEGRQPPCTEAIRAAGIAEVVVGMVDPDPRVQGRGLEQLHQWGIKVRQGIREQDCQALNPGYLTRQRLGRPRVLLKTAATLEGNVASHSGHSQWITGPAARRFGHQVRARVSAVMVGRGTLLADSPRLTARFDGLGPWWRGQNDHQPKRLVVGGEALEAGFPEEGGERWYLGPGLGPAFDRYLDLPRLPGGDLDWNQALQLLAAEGIDTILVEGGPTLAGSLVRSGLVDEWLAFVAPASLGGLGRPALAGEGSDRLTGARRGQISRVEQLGEDLLVWTLFGQGPSYAEQEDLLSCLLEERE